MVSKGTPSHRYKYNVSAKQLKESYEIRLAAQFGNEKSKKRLAEYNKRRRERQLEAGSASYWVDGRKLNRYGVMEYVVVQMANGMSLPEICQIWGIPSMVEIYSWEDNHPDFKRDLRRAEEIRGHILGEKALEIAMSTDRENVTADKLRVETLSKAAARSNQRFQDKVVQQNVDDLSSMSETQIRERIARMLEANPDLSVAFHHQLSGRPSVQEIEVLPELPDLPSLDCAQSDTPEVDD